MTIDPFRPLKNAFGRFATGVTVAACKNPDGAFTTITVNSFASVSLEPPLVLWCIDRQASSFEAFVAAQTYSISVLHDGQEAVSSRFAQRRPQKLAENEYEIWETGAPILKERLAGFDCKIIGRHRSGDHMILVGEVLRFDARPGAPLLYFASNYAKGPEAK